MAIKQLNPYNKMRYGDVRWMFNCELKKVEA